MNNSVKYTSRSYRAVYDPNAQGGPQLMEYESSSRGIRGSDCESISETRRRYTDSTGNERIGLARTLGQQGRLIQRDRYASGQEKAVNRLSHPDMNGTRFDEVWQQAARQQEVDRIPFLTSNRTRRFLSDSHTNEEREAARRGNQMFQEHTAHLMQQARQARPAQSQGNRLGGNGLPSTSRSSRNERGGSNIFDETAINFAREEAASFWR